MKTDKIALPPALIALRRDVLRALRGPDYRPVHAIPRKWPNLHAHVAGQVRILWGEGLLERVADSGSAGAVPAYRATADGLLELTAAESGQERDDAASESPVSDAAPLRSG